MSSGGKHTVVITPNWLGDCVMCLPVLQAFRSQQEQHRLTVCTRTSLQAFWDHVPVADAVIAYQRDGVQGAAGAIRDTGADRVIVLPNSIRTSWIAARSGVAERAGLRRPLRRIFLNQLLPSGCSAERPHQQYEYRHLFGLGEAALPLPELLLPSSAREEADSLLKDVAGPRWMFIPGAARGTSKQWPGTHFASLGKILLESRGGTVCLLGLPSEADLCDSIAAALPKGACLNLAGKASLSGWMALLKGADAVVANDSGGMHVAAALGTPTVGLFGMTDPAVTGPVGPRCRAVASDGPKSRDIPRESEEARKRLEAIKPEQVYTELETLLINHA